MTNQLSKDIFTESKNDEKLWKLSQLKFMVNFNLGRSQQKQNRSGSFDTPTPKQNSPSNQMKDWLPTSNSPVTGGLFYSLVVLESSLDLLPSFSDHLAYMKAVDLKCQNFHHSFQKGQNFWWGSKAEKYVLSTTGTVSQRTHHIVWFSEDGKRYTKLCKHFFSGILLPKLPPSMQLDLHINKKDAKANMC